MKTIVMFIALSFLIFPAVRGEPLPCDLAPVSCGSNADSVHVHADSFVCFKFYRKECGGSYTLIYQGPLNTFCDSGLEEGVYKYKAERFLGIEVNRCTDFSNDCESNWFDHNASPATCP